MVITYEQNKVQRPDCTANKMHPKQQEIPKMQPHFGGFYCNLGTIPPWVQTQCTQICTQSVHQNEPYAPKVLPKMYICATKVFTKTKSHPKCHPEWCTQCDSQMSTKFSASKMLTKNAPKLFTKFPHPKKNGCSQNAEADCTQSAHQNKVNIHQSVHQNELTVSPKLSPKLGQKIMNPKCTPILLHTSSSIRF